MIGKVRLWILSNRKWIFFFFILLFFVVLAKDILQKRMFDFDDTIFSFLEQFHNSSMTSFFKAITNLVSAPALVIICLIIWINISTRKYGKVVVLNLITVYLVNYLLKLLFARERPIGIALIEESGYSFPSGHSMVSMAYFGLFIYLIYHSHLRNFIKFTFILLLSFLVFLIGVSRIYLGVHYPSDVIGGFLLSVAYLILFTHLVLIQGKEVQ